MHSLAAILAEQRRAAAAVIAEPGRGVRLWLADWVAEELLIMEEAMSETKTMGQVLYEVLCSNGCQVFSDCDDAGVFSWEVVLGATPEDAAALETAAAAVIAAHEAQRPAWPAMRPMGDPDLHKESEILLAYECEREPGFKRTYKEIARQRLPDRWTTATYHVPFSQCVGWWPLPEVPHGN